MRARSCCGLTVALAVSLGAPAARAATARSPSRPDRGDRPDGRFRKGPYLQNVGPTSIAIMWESDSPMPGEVEVATTPPRRIAVGSDDIHEVLVDGLQAGKRYRYTVTVGGLKVAGEFATAPPPGTPFSFVVFGDSRESTGGHQRVVERIRGEVADFVLDTGDIVSEGQLERDWQTFFDIERGLLRDCVLFPSLGNHDRQGRGRTADNFRKYFSVPENSPDPERYYAFTYGSARFLVLDSNTYSFALTDQTEWIEQQLQAARLDPQVRHIFVSMHHPPYSVSLHGGQAELREAWTPLFEKYQVTAVFSGHDHVYERAEKNGVHYFVSGGGGAALYPRKARAARIDTETVQYFERVNHYLSVHVYGDLVEVTAIRADGSQIETTSWGKPPAGKRLVARAGAGAEQARGAGPHGPPGAAAAQGAGEGGIGWLAGLGGLLTLLAAGGTVWYLRR